jgi:tRNA pseudouridine55 synthase
VPPRALRPVGVALVDKPAGPSSFAVVGALRRLTGARTGHAGTLDPFATGLLILLSGAATRLAACFVGLDKKYVTDIDLTSTTSTGDPEGQRLEEHRGPSWRELEASLERLRGEVELPVPAASAVKIGGERAYRLARRGVAVEMPRRRTPVHALDVIAYSGGTVRLSLHVGSGTYVRAIAIALGGHCTTLRRTAVGPFSVDEAQPFGGDAAPGTAPGGGDASAAEPPLPVLLPVSEALDRLPADAVAAVPRAVVAGVLALGAGGDGAAA